MSLAIEKLLLDGIRHERMNPYYMPTPDEWRRQLERYGFRVPDQGLTGDAKPSQETKPVLVQSTRTVPPQGYLLADLPNDPKVITPPLSSTQKSVEPDKDHIWNMIVLAAQSSRYGS
jgi:hypothetical protein